MTMPVKGTSRGWGSPARYIQGPAERFHLSRYIKKYGNRVLIITGRSYYEFTNQVLSLQLRNDNIAFAIEEFKGEITEKAIDRIVERNATFSAEVVLGIGGGKVLDTAKAVSEALKTFTMLMPTVVSSDAPSTSFSVMYTEEGAPLQGRHYDRTPDLIVVDSQIIASAPVRYFIAGMGDALSTVFEARACHASDSANLVYFREGGFRATVLGREVAEICYKTLLKDGKNAVYAVRHHAVTEALENIIEVNTLMSSLGVENNGCAAAHSIFDALGSLSQGNASLHGEKVAFGVICQMVIENASSEQMEETLQFCTSVGLPITLEELAIPNDDETIAKIAHASIPSNWAAEPFYTDEALIRDTIRVADMIGHEYHKCC